MKAATTPSRPSHQSKANAHHIARGSASRGVALQPPQAQSIGFEDKRPEAVAQRKLHALANNSPQVRQLQALQDMANENPRTQNAAQLDAVANARSAAMTQSKEGLEQDGDGMGAKALAMQIKANEPGRFFGHLAETLSAVQPSFTDTGIVLQARIRIGKQTYTHGSRRLVNQLFENVVAPKLEQLRLKTYGAKSALVRFIRMYRDAYPVKTYSDVNNFWVAFFPWLMKQTRKVRGGKTTPLIKPFEVSKMSRPGWPKEYGEKLGKIAGDNIRHVIRNATLKRALQVAFDWKLKFGSIKDLRMSLQQFATMLKIKYDEKETVDVLARKVYKKLYLNIENLFAGRGDVNQVIGFAADPVRELGETLVAMGTEPINIEGVFGHVFGILDNIGKRIRGDRAVVKNVVTNIKHTLIELAESIKSNNKGSVYVPCEIVGNILIDVGLNFGFDLIDSRDNSDIKERQKRLLQVERELQLFIESGGKKGDIASSLQKFLDLEDTKGESGKEKIGLLDKEDKNMVNILLRTNNCLINAIARPILRRNANLFELVTIRAQLVERGFPIGSMLVASPAILNIIRTVFRTNRGIIVHYQNSDLPSDSVDGPSPIVIDHSHAHFQER